jgi:hypothetical protein
VKPCRYRAAADTETSPQRLHLTGPRIAWSGNRGWRPAVGGSTPATSARSLATLGPVIYAFWVATLAGRMAAARRLLIGSVIASLVVKGPIMASGLLVLVTQHGISASLSDDLFGLRRPPASVLVLLLPLAVIGCLARQAWQTWESFQLLAITVPLLLDRILLGKIFAGAGGNLSSTYWSSMHWVYQLALPTVLVVIVAAVWWRWRTGPNPSVVISAESREPRR